VVLDHVLDANARRPFLSGLGEKNHVTVERHVEPFQRQHRHQRGDDVVLVVDGAAAVDIAAVARSAERGERPLLGVDRDHVGMSHQEQRALGAIAFEPRNHVDAVRL
jgi:hypothetical protein